MALQIFDESANAYQRVRTSSALSSGWHFVVGTYDGTGGDDATDGMNLYVDGILSSMIPASNMAGSVWNPNTNAVFMLGGKAWDGIITPLASSVDGVVDNLRVFNYAKSDFSHSINNETLEQIRPSDELIEISIDGVNFYGSNTRGTNLPLLVRNIDPGAEFKVYIRNRQQQGTTSLEGQERSSFLQIVKSRAG